MYKIVLTKKARKDIEKLDIVAMKRLKKALVKFSTDPKNYSIKLSGSADGAYRFRVGNYRIIFDMHIDEIIILRIQHRREVYRNL